MQGRGLCNTMLRCPHPAGRLARVWGARHHDRRRAHHQRPLRPPAPGPPVAAATLAADAISSPTNPYIKHCVRLRESASYRAEQRRVLLVGRPLLTELAEALPGGARAHVLFLREGGQDARVPGISATRAVRVSEPVMRKLTGLENVEGVDAVAELPIPDALQLAPSPADRTADPAHASSSGGGGSDLRRSATSSAALGPAGRTVEGRGDAGSRGAASPPALRRLLVLEGVQDPGNLGTLLRCALAFGWDAAWLLPGCCDPFNDKALRASRGAALRLPLASGGWAQLQAAATERGMLLLAAEPDEEGDAAAGGGSGSGTGSGSGGDGDGCGSVDGCSLASVPRAPVALVLGAEGRGLSGTALAACRRVSIPMAGAMESLNVGVAGGILMFALSSGLPPLVQRLGRLCGSHDALPP